MACSELSLSAHTGAGLPRATLLRHRGAEARRRVGKIAFGERSIDENGKTTNQYGIRGLPTLLLFDKGQVVAQKVGALSMGQLQRFLDTNLK